MVSTNTTDNQGKHPESSIIVLDPHQKGVLRAALVESSKLLLGIKYVFGAEWTDLSKPPSELDCSELVEGVYTQNGLRMPDGSQQQFNFTLSTANPQPGDLIFFGKGQKISEIYHVGLVFSEVSIIEARGFQPESSFETGKVIIRPRSAWESYKNFVGYRAHPKLI